MKELLHRAWAYALDIVFPAVCLTCRKPLNTEEKSRFLCEHCFSSIRINNSLICPICGSRMPENKKTCHTESSFRLGAASSYDNEIIKRLIWLLKYGKKTVAARPLAHVLYLYAKELPITQHADYLVPIPLHPTRERFRGFNQAERIVYYMSENLRIPMLENVLVKTKNTKPQAETKNKDERASNLKESFHIRDKNKIAGKNILLIDDVFTSGATANEAIKTLRRSGVKNIIVLVVAKA